MTKYTAQSTDNKIDPADYPPGYLDEPLSPSEAAKLVKKTKNAMAVDRSRERGPPYSKDGKDIKYTRRDIFSYYRQHRRIPLNNTQ